jgi:hypothetical protein
MTSNADTYRRFCCVRPGAFSGLVGVREVICTKKGVDSYLLVREATVTVVTPIEEAHPVE